MGRTGGRKSVGGRSEPEGEGCKGEGNILKKCRLRHDLAETGCSVKGSFVLLDVLLNGELCVSSPAVSEQ